MIKDFDPAMEIGELAKGLPGYLKENVKVSSRMKDFSFLNLRTQDCSFLLVWTVSQEKYEIVLCALMYEGRLLSIPFILA